MTRRYRLDNVLLADGWAQARVVSVDADGTILAIDAQAGDDAATAGAFANASASAGAAATASAGAAATASAAAAPADGFIEHIRGYVIPGMANAHSHAFQRGMAGHTEYRLSAQDSFWTWREAMYALANRIEPADLELIATQLFVEMLKAGYTSVAEFHYLHRRIDGGLAPQGNPLWTAIDAAAGRAGIGLTLLPTLYQMSDFGAVPLKPEQARFRLDAEYFVQAIETRRRAERTAPGTLLRTGAAFHSLRAVPIDTVKAVGRELRELDATLPIHMHVAEQVKEVEACQAHCGRRPIELLLESGVLDPHWCLVHATHAAPAELAGIAQVGAPVCLSITTEANLGDGLFDAERFLAAGGRLCIGSDSQASVSPAEELRWLEYQQRLRTGRRAVLADAADTHTHAHTHARAADAHAHAHAADGHAGTRLWRHAALHGARAIGQPAGALSVGRRADWLVLDPFHPSMAGATPASALDHLLFAGGSAAIRDVMVGGRWVVRQGRHAVEEALAVPFAALLARLRSKSA